MTGVEEIRMIAGMRRLYNNGRMGSIQTQGPQGDSVVDWHAEYIERYGAVPDDVKLGNEDIEDIRDNRDPVDVYEEYTAEKARKSNGHGK